MSLKISSALVGLSLAVCCVTGGAVVTTSNALAQDIDCSHLDTNTQAWVNCARRQTNQIRRDIRKHEDECDRGGCGPKARQIQKRINRESDPNKREADVD